LARKSTQYVCQSCGSAFQKWAGRCDTCGEWNTLTEEVSLEATPKGLKGPKGRKIQFVGLTGPEKQPARRVSGIIEFDRVCGGGLVAGSALLVGGDPGIGKSTLLIQVLAALSAKCRCAYISGEESIHQIRLRAERLGLSNATARLATTTSVRDVIASMDGTDAPQIVVIDSIQTMFVDNLDSAPGTVAQVRSSSQELIRLAKRQGFALILVGHVTKDGAIAGPRVLEHMVDTVLYFEGDRSHQFRILRAVKNRFGPTDEIGVFEMSQQGLQEVSNPSSLFLGETSLDISGASVFAGIEGSRPVLVEIQALIAPSSQATPRRAVVGWDSARLAMIMAVLETRTGLALGGSEVYLNVAGGLKISEPAADLAVAVSLISSSCDVAVPEKTIIFGEIGLSGEIRSVSQVQARLKEAAKLGFIGAIIPKQNERSGKKQTLDTFGLELTEIGNLKELLALFATALAKNKSQDASGQRLETTRPVSGQEQHSA